MTQLALPHVALPDSITVCGVECRQLCGSSYGGSIGQLSVVAHLDRWGATVALYRDTETLACGSGESLSAAEQAMEAALRRRTTMLADAALTMAARGVL